MKPRPRISFGKIAHRVGAVSLEDLEKARQLREEKGGKLDEILLESGALTPELAEFVREAFVRACAICEGCGRRTDGGDVDARSTGGRPASPPHGRRVRQIVASDPPAPSGATYAAVAGIATMASARARRGSVLDLR